MKKTASLIALSVFLIFGVLLLPVSIISTPPLPQKNLYHLPKKNVSVGQNFASCHPRPPLESSPISEPHCQRKTIANEIQNLSTGHEFLGKIEVLASDMAEMDNGSFQRQSVIHSSKTAELVLIIEHYDENRGFLYSSFHSAERVIVRVENEVLRHAVRSSLPMLGYSAEGESGWHEFIAVRVPPEPEKIFASKESLGSLVGSSGSVFLAGVLPK
jgi:hypothetical protein